MERNGVLSLEGSADDVTLSTAIDEDPCRVSIDRANEREQCALSLSHCEGLQSNGTLAHTSQFARGERGCRRD